MTVHLKKKHVYHRFSSFWLRSSEKNMYIDYNSITKHIAKGSSLCPSRIHVILETEKATSEQVLWTRDDIKLSDIKGKFKRAHNLTIQR